MSKNLIAMPILVLVLFAAGMPALFAQQQAGTPLKEIGDLLVGRWMFEITWAVDYPGLGKKGEKVIGYEVCRWIADRAALECEFMGGKANGKSTYWWDATSKQVRVLDVDSGGNWAEGTVSKQGPKLACVLSGGIIDGNRVEYKWEISFQDSGNTRISEGATILNGVRNPFKDTHKRVAK
jgi:hypothetical protein